MSLTNLAITKMCESPFPTLHNTLICFRRTAGGVLEYICESLLSVSI